MEPMMLVAFLAIGFAAVFAALAFRNGSRETAEEKVMKGYFLLGLSGLMAKIAMADGSVSTDEAGLAQRFFGQMALSDADRALCIGNFVTSRRDGLEVRDHAKRFMAYANRTACEFLYSLLWRLADADGKLDPGEDKLLGEVARYLGLDESVYVRFKNGERPTYKKEDLLAAGVPKSLVG